MEVLGTASSEGFAAGSVTTSGLIYLVVSIHIGVVAFAVAAAVVVAVAAFCLEQFVVEVEPMHYVKNVKIAVALFLVKMIEA